MCSDSVWYPQSEKWYFDRKSVETGYSWKDNNMLGHLVHKNNQTVYGVFILGWRYEKNWAEKKKAKQIKRRNQGITDF